MANFLGQLVSRPSEGYGKVIQGADPFVVDGGGVPIVSEAGDAYAGAIRIGGGWGRLIGLMLMYMAQGGPGTGQTLPEYLSAAGMELDPSMAQPEGEPKGLFNAPN